jgi:hypothetical protein
MLSIWSLPTLRIIKSILMLIVIRYGWNIFKNDVLLMGGYSIQRLTQVDDHWLLHDCLRTETAKLSGDSTVTNYVCILRFVCEDKRKRSTVIFKDALSAEQYKRLLVAVRTTAIHNKKPIST